MSADHKGPLAAFVVVAVVAAILLVTSVRSQAEPGWLSLPLPAAVAVVAPPTVATPGLVAVIGSHLGHAVASGSALVRKAAPVTPAAPVAAVAVDTIGIAQQHQATHHGSQPGRQVTRTRTHAHQLQVRKHGPSHVRTRHHGGAAHRGSHAHASNRWGWGHWRHAGLAASHAPGRHLGWTKSHGRGARTR